MATQGRAAEQLSLEHMCSIPIGERIEHGRMVAHPL